MKTWEENTGPLIEENQKWLISLNFDLFKSAYLGAVINF